MRPLFDLHLIIRRGRLLCERRCMAIDRWEFTGSARRRTAEDLESAGPFEQDGFDLAGRVLRDANPTAAC